MRVAFNRLFFILSFGLVVWALWPSSEPIEDGALTPSRLSAEEPSLADGSLDSEAHRLSVSPNGDRNPVGAGDGRNGIGYYRDLYRPLLEGNWAGGDVTGIPWWYEDPECLALFEAQYEVVLPGLSQEFAARRLLESSLGDQGRGRRHLLELLSSEEAAASGAVSASLALFSEQVLDPDAAIHLGNMLLLQSRNLRSRSWQQEGDADHLDPFSLPVEAHLEQMSGVPLDRLAGEVVSSASSEWAVLLMEVAEVRRQAQLYHAACFHACRQLGLLTPTAPEALAKLSSEYRRAQDEERILFDRFRAAVSGLLRR